MQPYFFPYIGYFQLIDAVDKFVIFDDVNYINRGWINRNRILINGKESIITLPLKAASQNKKINEIDLLLDGKEQQKMLRTIELNYKKAPFFEQVFHLICQIFKLNTVNISNFNYNQICIIRDYLGIKTDIVKSSQLYGNQDLKGEARIIDICEKEHAREYINPSGGLDLYNKERFKEKGINLFFLQPKPIVYTQLTEEFIPWLSIIDVLMFNSVNDVKYLLKQYQLV